MAILQAGWCQFAGAERLPWNCEETYGPWHSEGIYPFSKAHSWKDYID